MLTPTFPTMLTMDSTKLAMMHPTTILLILTMTTSQMLTKSMTPLSLSLIRAVNLIKEKRSGKLKGRTCADGRCQRAHYTREETPSLKNLKQSLEK
jgi:hypothetical protein